MSLGVASGLIFEALGVELSSSLKLGVDRSYTPIVLVFLQSFI